MGADGVAGPGVILCAVKVTCFPCKCFLRSSGGVMQMSPSEWLPVAGGKPQSFSGHLLSKLGPFLWPIFAFLKREGEKSNKLWSCQVRSMCDCRGLDFWCDLGRRSVRKGTPLEQPFAVQLLRPALVLHGWGGFQLDVLLPKNLSLPWRRTGLRHPPAGWGLRPRGMPGLRGAVGGEDHAVIKSSLESKGGCQPCSFIWAL